MIQTIAFLRSLAFFCVVSIFGGCVSAQYDGPESVEYDPIGDRYFVSNTGSGLIRIQDQTGAVTTLVDTEGSPYGMELLGDTLFACIDGGIKGYSTQDGELVFDLDLGGGFLNGITTDGTYLYTTDFGDNKIFKVDVANSSSSVLVANTSGTPNGIVWDPIGERLVVVFWGTNAPIKSFDRSTGAAQTLVANSGVGNIDGVAIDCLGNFLVASWNPDRITRFEPTFTMAGVNTGITGLNNPADMDLDGVNNRLCIPNTGTNSVILADVSCTNGIPEQVKYTMRTIPNPTAGLVRLDPPLRSTEPFMVLDARGLLQATGSLRANALLDLGDLPAGLYSILFTRLAHQVRVVKE